LHLPADQVIQTDQTNILIRALTLKKKKEDTVVAAASNKGKRYVPLCRPLSLALLSHSS
jgi:hypothetical protein